MSSSSSVDLPTNASVVTTVLVDTHIGAVVLVEDHIVAVVLVDTPIVAVTVKISLVFNKRGIVVRVDIALAVHMRVVIALVDLVLVVDMCVALAPVALALAVDMFVCYRFLDPCSWWHSALTSPSCSTVRRSHLVVLLHRPKIPHGLSNSDICRAFLEGAQMLGQLRVRERLNVEL